MSTDWEFVPVARTDDPGEMRGALEGADAFIGNVFAMEWRDAAARLQLIHCVGAGVDAIPLAAIPPGCTLCNVYEHEVPIAEHILMMVLLFVTRLRETEARFRRGEWADSSRVDGGFHEEAWGKTLGLLGYGHIGRETARRARAFGMKVAAIARTPREEDGLDWYGTRQELDRLLEMSDYLAIVCPLTEETRGMIGEAQLRRLRPSACLINVARAEIVQEEPLYRALRERWFAGAALDVWYQYPSRPGVRLHGSRLAFHELDNVILTPHSSAWTEALMRRRFARIAANLDRLARGEALERVIYRANSS